MKNFPWKELAKVKLAHWHQLNEKELIKYRLKKLIFRGEKFFYQSTQDWIYKSSIKKLYLKKDF